MYYTCVILFNIKYKIYYRAAAVQRARQLCRVCYQRAACRRPCRVEPALASLRGFVAAAVMTAALLVARQGSGRGGHDACRRSPNGQPAGRPAGQLINVLMSSTLLPPPLSCRPAALMSPPSYRRAPVAATLLPLRRRPAAAAVLPPCRRPPTALGAPRMQNVCWYCVAHNQKHKLIYLFWRVA
jgi:hypothetical protein